MWKILKFDNNPCVMSHQIDRFSTILWKWRNKCMKQKQFVELKSNNSSQCPPRNNSQNAPQNFHQNPPETNLEIPLKTYVKILPRNQLWNAPQNLRQNPPWISYGTIVGNQSIRWLITHELLSILLVEIGILEEMFDFSSWKVVFVSCTCFSIFTKSLKIDRSSDSWHTDYCRFGTILLVEIGILSNSS